MGMCSQAIAYVKVDQKDQPGPSISLNSGNAPVTRQLQSGLVVCYVVDANGRLEFIQERHLAEEQVSAEDLHATGMANLASRTASGIQVRDQGHWQGLLFDGNFEASLILLDSLWEESLKDKVSTGFVVCIPSRDILAFCDRDSVEGIRSLRQVVDRVWEGGDHLLTRTLYVREGKTWKPLKT